MRALSELLADVRACRRCAEHLPLGPRPVLQLHGSARILIAAQAPGRKVHAHGIPFDDASGDRLRGWLGLSREQFYDAKRVAILPMGFCFPGYDARGSDLPPPALCAATWRARVLKELQPRVTLLIGGHAIRWHLGLRGVTAAVAGWRDHAPRVFPLPHPSWRNTAWLKRNPWFEAELVLELRRTLAEVL